MHSRNQMTAERSISWTRLPRLSWLSCQILWLRMALVMSTGALIFISFIHCNSLINAVLASSSINHVYCSSGAKGIILQHRVWKVLNTDRRTASLSRQSYRLLQPTSFICGVPTSQTYPSHSHCQVLMGGRCCTRRSRIWEITWVGDRSIVGSSLYPVVLNITGLIKNRSYQQSL